MEIALNMDSIATKRTLYAGTLVLATNFMSIQPNVTPKSVTMHTSPSACVTLTAVIIRCQKVEIAWTILVTFQQHPSISTGLDPLATKHEMCANAWYRWGKRRRNVRATTNVYPDVLSKNLNRARGFGDSNLILIQIG